MKNEEKTLLKKKKGRSISYPAVPLDEAIMSVKSLRDSLGKGPYSKEEIAKALNYKGLSGASHRKIAALAHFGLLERDGTVYKQSSLAERIAHPLSEEDKKQAVREAAYAPKLFFELITEYEGQALPNMLNNILVRKGVKENVSDDVVNIFKTTLEFVDVLKNGIVLKKSDVGQERKDTKTEDDLKKKENNIDEEIPSESYLFKDSGKGWSMRLETKAPLNVDARKKIIELVELLEDSKENNEKEL